MFKRIVTVIEIVVLLGAAVFFVLLFANEPGSGRHGAPPRRARRCSRRTARRVTAATAEVASVRNSPTARSRPRSPTRPTRSTSSPTDAAACPRSARACRRTRSNSSSSTRGRCKEGTHHHGGAHRWHRGRRDRGVRRRSSRSTPSARPRSGWSRSAFAFRKLREDNPIAFHGEAGYQATLLMPGLRFKLWPIFCGEEVPVGAGARRARSAS